MWFIKFVNLTILIIFFFSFSSVASAQTTSTQSASPSALYKPIPAQNYNLPLHTDYLVASLTHTFSCLGAGVSVIGQPCLNAVATGGALGEISHLMTVMMATPPIHAPEYLAYVFNNLGLAKEAHAQVWGTGNQVVSTVMTLWQVSRNFTYLVMVMVFVTIGIMIMFRQKINPQTIVNIQSALPGLVIGLVLITFSYFLSALLVDTAYVGTWVVGHFFLQTQQQLPGAPAPQNIVGIVLPNHNVLSIFSQFVNIAGIFGPANPLEVLGGAAFRMADEIRPFLQPPQITGNAQTILQTAAGFLGCQYATNITSPLQGIPVAGGIFTGGSCAEAARRSFGDPAWAIGLALFLILMFIMLYSMVRLLLKLINNYLMILFLTFTAPFHFLAASLPGRQDIIATWVRNMLCNVLAFPGVFAAFYFAAYLVSPRPELTAFNIPPGHQMQGIIVSGQVLPLLGGLDPFLLRFLLAFGVLVATPSIPDVICELIGKVGRASQIISGGIESGIRGGQGQVQQVIGAAGAGGQAIARARWSIPRRPVGGP